MTPPPAIVIPAPAASGKKNGFDRFIATHPALGQYKTTIQQWSGEYGVPALWVAAAIWKESKGQNVGWNAKVRGAGLAQLNIAPNNQGSPPGAAAAVLGRQPTYQDAMNPDTAIQILAYSMQNSASLDDWYQRTWNPGFTPTAQNVLPSSYLKGYPVSVTGHTASQKVAGEAAVAQAKAQNLPYLQAIARQKLDPIYLAYAGRKASAAEIQAQVNNPVSDYQIELNLSNPKTNPGIYKSLIWQTNEGRFTAWYQDIYGPNAQVPKSVILDGIIHNKDQAGFYADLRKGAVPGAAPYSDSEKFKGDLADVTKVYAGIYGNPDDAGNNFLKYAVNNGWNQSQVENYLRSQPEYKQSGEYKVRSIDLASRMGLIQGVPGGAQTALATPPPPATPAASPAGAPAGSP